MREGKATEEVSSLQKRTSNTSNHEKSSSFFPLLDPDPADQNQCGPPDPQHCCMSYQIELLHMYDDMYSMEVDMMYRVGAEAVTSG
jgi:hypothetical protein